MKIKVKTILREILFLNEIDLYENDDPINERIPHQKPHNLNQPLFLYL